MKKHNIIKLLTLILLFVGMQKNVSAQLEQSIFINGIAPVGEFNSSLQANAEILLKDNIAKDATVGFGAGYRAGYVFDIGVGEITPFASLDVMWNRIPSEYRSNFIQYSQKLPNYLNIPILVGVNYRYAFNDVLIPFAEFGLGYDFMMITKAGPKDHYWKYRVGGAFAWQVGVGTYLGNHFSVGVHFYGLGLHSINYRDPQGANSLRHVNQMALRLGFHI